MSNSAKQKTAVKPVDPVWSAIFDDAQAISTQEPTLSNLVMSAVLNHETFEGALAFRLAERLGNSEVSADLIRQAFDEINAETPDVGHAARADVAATLERDPACHRAIDPFLYFKGFQAIQTHRYAHELQKSGRPDLAHYLQSRASQVFQVDINPKVHVGRGIMLDHGTGVVVGETAEIGDHVSILQGVTLGGTGKVDGDRHPKIGSGVLIGAGAKILGNIKIGDCARVAAGSVVLADVPKQKTVAGVPAKIVGDAGCAQPALVMDQIILNSGTS